VAASVFVDAGLPDPQSALDALAVRAAEQLRGMAIEGRQPRWTSWWPLGILE
jgi:hypothetical protein